ncbi:MAG: ATP-dependent RNA helicase HrpA [Desulfobacterales bacterium]
MTKIQQTHAEPAKAMRLQYIRSLLPEAMPLDRMRIEKQLSRLYKRFKDKKQEEFVLKKLAALEKQLEISKAVKKRRKSSRPFTRYPSGLPILSKKNDIVEAIKRHPVLIVSGETGSGKTTQIPKFCLDAGRGVDGKIGCTQPRRIAAVTVANRIAEELGDVGSDAVGYKIRFTDNVKKNAYIKIMTDGILLAETQKDPCLCEYDTLIVDEAHERSLNIDFVLGILKKLLKQRDDLKLIITSATIDTEKFSKAFDDALIIEVSGRTFPVDVRYMEADDEDDADASYVDKAVSAVDHLMKTRTRGDILVFMPTEQDILETRDLIEGRSYTHVTVMPLFARLAGKNQTKVFARTRERKIIVATNIAETSITIPGIRYVIDTGLARIPRYSPRTRTTSLQVSQVSKSSADQRKGRCGRVENGICIRLYSEKNYESRPLYTPPEILRANLAEVILRMMSLKIGEVAAFPFIDPPAQKSITDGFDLLMELGAIQPLSPGKKSKHFRITPKGRLMARVPVDPRISCMLIEAGRQDCLKGILIIAAALSAVDPRERPVEKAQAADEKHGAFKDPSSDFLTLVNIWNRYQDLKKSAVSNNRLRLFCKEHFLSYRKMREWEDIHQQIVDLLEEAGPTGLHQARKARTDGKKGFDPTYTAIHKSILSGFLSNIAVRKENNLYKAAKDREIMIFPGSTLFGKAAPWVVAGEIVKTSRVYARTVAAIDEKWLEEIGKSQCTYTWHNPRWDRRRGEVTATEQVSLFGLVIVPGRTVSYGRINPKEASAVFIQRALVEGDVDEPFAFLEHNETLVENVKNVENKLRKRDILIGEQEFVLFYQRRLGECRDIRTLKHIIRQKGDEFLKLNQEDLFLYTPENDDLALYPDRVKLGKTDFACEYRFDPGEPEDGLTIKVPLALAPHIPQTDLEWLVPGFYKEKITALLRGLPKAYRKKLVPVADTVDVIVSEMPKNRTSLLTALGNFIHERFGLDIPAEAWTEQPLPDYLKMRIAITGKKGQEIRSGRDPSVLIRRDSDSPADNRLIPIKRQWERRGIVAWDFEDLPESLQHEDKDGTRWVLYPGLQATGRKSKTGARMVDLHLFLDRHEAEASHKAGVGALYRNHFSNDLKFLKKNLILPDAAKPTLKLFGGKKAVEEHIYEHVVKQLFFKNIRTQTAFVAHAGAVGPVLIETGRNVLEYAIPVMTGFYETKSRLHRLKAENRFTPVLYDFICELDMQVDRLVPENFMRLYSSERLSDIRRYLQAVVIRAGRALVSPEKDRAKAHEIKVFTDRLERFLGSLTPRTSPEKKNAIESFFWLIEEYKVSVFAQELKTPVKVSSKKLAELAGSIERMA